MGLTIFVACAFGFLYQNVSAQNEILKVGYLPPSEELDFVKEYNLSLLRLALAKTKNEGIYKVIYQESKLSQREALKSLRDASLLLVVPTMTDRYRQKVFLPIKIPLYKGLFGVRLLMMREVNAEKLSVADNIEELQNFSFGQGFDWPDTQILRANNFDVDEYRTKDELFEALNKNEFDFFPRSVAEIWPELEQRESLNFTWHKGAYFYYPTAIYFFTQNTDAGQALSERLERGLNIALDDGSFDQLFNSYLSEYINRAELDSLKIIHLKNPLLPEGVPLGDEKYWYITPKN
jgi:hypothetical protein